MTFSTLGLFERHRRDSKCLDPTDDLVADEEGVFWTPEGLENLYRLQNQAKNGGWNDVRGS